MRTLTLVLAFLIGCATPNDPSDTGDTGDADADSDADADADSDADSDADADADTGDPVDPLDVDDDDDGYTENGGDCDDTQASVYPGAMEIEDGLDNDCDGIVDEGTNAYDDDGDGFSENDGDCDDTNSDLTPEDWDRDGYSSCDGDCNDRSSAIGPLVYDGYGDGIDQNCDGQDGYDFDRDGLPVEAGDCDDTRADVWQNLPGYLDVDGDGYGTGALQTVCSGDTLYPGYATVNGDCDDLDALINPEAEEVWYNGVDENCDGNDQDQDFDGEDVGDWDCDDRDPLINKRRIEVNGDGIDNNCDGTIDDFKVTLLWTDDMMPIDWIVVGIDYDVFWWNLDWEDLEEDFDWENVTWILDTMYPDSSGWYPCWIWGADPEKWAPYYPGCSVETTWDINGSP